MNHPKNHTILSVGSMAFDSVRTPTGRADNVLGGSVNYFSLAASPFTEVKIVAVVGEEWRDVACDELGGLHGHCLRVSYAREVIIYGAVQGCRSARPARTKSMNEKLIRQFESERAVLRAALLSAVTPEARTAARDSLAVLRSVRSAMGL